MTESSDAPEIRVDAPPSPDDQRGRNGLAVASLVSGIAGLVTYWPLPLVAVILGHVALHQIKQRHQRGRGLAVAGVVLGYLGIAVAITIVLVLVLAMSGGED